jgi:hypothetical protein
MILKRPLKFVFGLLLLMAAPTITLAQDCPASDPSLWTAAAAACINAAANQACFGGGYATVKARADAPAFSFAVAGDVAESGALKSIDLDAGSAAVIHTPANLKDGQATLVLFGDAMLKDDASGKYKSSQPVSGGEANFTLQATTWFQGTLLNRTPDLIALDTVATVDKGVTLTLNGRTGDTPQDYVSVIAPDGSVGWTTPGMFKLADGTSVDQAPDFLRLPLVDIDAVRGLKHAPFERITFTPSTPCADNGLLIQVPKTDGHDVWFEINGQVAALQSTLFVYTTADGGTVYNTLEGDVTLYGNDTAVAIPGGGEATVAPDGTISPVQPYDPSIINDAPVGLLPDVVTPDPPLGQSLPTPGATPPATPEPGVWALEIWFWEVDGDCPYPPSIVSAMPVLDYEFNWDGGPSDLVNYWTSGFAQMTALTSGIDFLFTQEGSDYVFSSVGKTTTNQLTFRRVGDYSFAVFSSIFSGTDCVLTGKGKLSYIGVKS